MSILPAGRYNARAVDAKMGRTQTGKEQVGVLFEIMDPAEQAGTRITWYGYFTEKTVDRTLESLEHCGWNGNSLGAGDLDTARGEVQIVIEHEADQKGEQRARVKWVNSIGGLQLGEVLDEASIQKLNQQLKGKLLARKQSAKPAQQKQTNGDEPPF